MNLDQLIQSVCISINDFVQSTRENIKVLVPTAVEAVVGYSDWEFRRRPFSPGLSITANNATSGKLLPKNLDRIIALRRGDYKEPLEYIEPQEYNRRLSDDATPYGDEL